MIDKETIRKAIDKKIIHFEINPHMEGETVCFIGDYWFYFGGQEAEEMTPEEYMKNVPMDDIVNEVYNTLESFKEDTFSKDEYEYYESVILENL